MDEFATMPGHLIRRVQQAATAIFARECAQLDVTSVQYAALSAISTHPGVDATRLSALIAFDRSTIGDVLERLEIKGWITRLPSLQDRRVKSLDLSAQGIQMLLRLQPAVRRVQERILSPLSSADRTTFLRLLTELVDCHKDVTPAPTVEACR